MSKKALGGVSFQSDCQVFQWNLVNLVLSIYTDQKGLPFCHCDETCLVDSKEKALLFGLLVDFRTISKGSRRAFFLSHAWLWEFPSYISFYWIHFGWIIIQKEKKRWALWGILFDTVWQMIHLLANPII